MPENNELDEIEDEDKPPWGKLDEFKPDLAAKVERLEHEKAELLQALSNVRADLRRIDPENWIGADMDEINKAIDKAKGEAK